MQKDYFVTIRTALFFQEMLQEEVFLTLSSGVPGTAKQMTPVQVNQ